MFKIKIVILLLICTAFNVYAQDQVTARLMLKTELDKRGLSEEEANAALIAKGIDVSQLSLEQQLMKKNEIVAVLDEAAKSKTPIEIPKVEPVDTLKLVKEVIKEAIVNESVSKVSIYGHSVFTDGGIQVQTVTDGANAPENYVLGSGDQIRITIFGISQADLLLTINEAGFVTPSGLAQIYLKGVTLKEARKIIRNRFAVAYRFQSDEFAVTLQKARLLSVSVFGEVRKSGSIQISALNSALNALVFVGGVNEIASVRNIDLLRGDKRRKIDLYAFLNNPSVQFNFDLQYNDIVYVPVANKIISVEGAVKRPMKYELIEKEGLKELIQFAGGIQFNTNIEFIQIERAMGAKPQLIEYALNDVLSGKTIVELKDGDIVRVKSSSEPLDDFIVVDGAVFYPGKYAWKANMTLNEALLKSKLKPQTHTDFYFVERTLNDNTVKILKVTKEQALVFVLNPKDKLLIFDKSVYANQLQIEIQGAVRAPFKKNLEYSDHLKLSEVIALAKGTLPTTSEWAYLRRQSLFEPNKFEYYRINLLQDSAFVVGAGDLLMVYDKSIYSHAANVTVSGAVHQVVKTPFSPNLTLANLLNLAGRTNEKADIKRVDLFRLKYSNKYGSGYELIQLELDSNYTILNQSKALAILPFDHIVVRELMKFETNKLVVINGEVKYPGQYALPYNNYRLTDLIQDAGGLTVFADKYNAQLLRSTNNIGPMGLNIRKAFKHKHSDKYNPLLMPGDDLTLFTFNNAISIKTEGTNYPMFEGKRTDEVSFFYNGKHSALWYLKKYAGGLHEDADKNTVTVLYPNGKVVGVKRTILMIKKYPRVQPGCKVNVGRKAQKQSQEKKKLDSDAIFTRTYQAITSFLTLMLLLKQL
jgi:protein involved in polysaccharide export with SLBB domain